MDKTRLLNIFRHMILIRRFEEAVYDFHEQKHFGGHYHLYIGQEATGAAVMASLGTEDRIFSTHRNHGHLIARGVDPKKALAEILNRADGTNGGRGGTFHLADASVGMPHTSALVGGSVPLAAGAGGGTAGPMPTFVRFARGGPDKPGAAPPPTFAVEPSR